MITLRSTLYGLTLVLGLMSARESLAQEPVADTNSAPAAPSAAVSAKVQKLMAESNQNLDNNQLDAALASVDSALQLDPKNASLYELRGTIYIKQKLWDRAENDYKSALQIDPTTVSFKYKLAEIDFLQKAYASARAGFQALQGDPTLGELAKYKVFLCDLMGYQESIARRDLDALNAAPEKRQAYYLCNAVWALYHKDRPGAGEWFAKASRLYSTSELDLYLSALRPSDALAAPVLSFTTKNGTSYTNAKVFVVGDGLRVSTPTGWSTVPFDQLPSDLSSFPADLQKQIEVKQNPPPAVLGDTETLSFTTRAGKKYDKAKWSVDDNGLRVLTPDGWNSVTFDQLPEDLSSFPASAREQIAAKLKAAAEKAAAAAQASPDDSTNDMARANDLSAEMARTAEASQFNLHPPEAKDCHFGSCVAMEGNMFAVGADGATYVYENGELKARLCPEVDSTHTGDLVNSISISHQTLVTCTREDVYVWVKAAHGWKLQAHWKFPNASTIVVDGDNIVVAANGNGASNNVVSFYVRKGETWQPAPRSINRDNLWRSADQFGHLVDTENNLALIGIPNWNKDAYTNTGPAYSGRVLIEKFDGQTWREIGPLVSTEANVGANQFGQSVALSGDLIAVSSTNRDNIDYAPHHGVVHLFQRAGNETSWTKKITLRGPDSTNDAGFGCGPLALSQRTLAITDPGVKAHVPNVKLDTGTSTGKPGDIKGVGAVYVYDNQVLQDTLMAPDPVDNLTQTGSPDQFGTSLAINGDTILVGAPGKDGGAGAVYVWKRQDKRWHLDAEIKGFHKQANYNY